MGRTATLVEMAGDHVGRQHRLLLPLAVVGRSVRSDIQLAQEAVSRIHAEVLRRDGSYVVRDRHSKNGTFVNATPIDEHILAEGDEVTVGRTVLRFTWASGGGGDLPPAPEGSKGGGTPGAASIGAWARRGGGWRG